MKTRVTLAVLICAAALGGMTPPAVAGAFACCHEDQSCSYETDFECASYFPGVFFPGESCDAGCIGACTTSGGSCTVIDAWSCRELDGTFARAASCPDPDVVSIYQGQLKKDGQPISGTADFIVELIDQGRAILDGREFSSVAVANGLFTLNLNFAPTLYNNAPRWLRIWVRSPASVGEYTELAPAQLIAGAPRSLNTRGLNVDDAGRVGIGTAEPQMSLDVTMPSFYNAPAIGGTNGSNYAYLHVATDHSMIWNNTSAMRFGTESAPGTGYSEIMRVTPAGNVGIGTAAPTSKLDVAGVAEMDGLKLNGHGAAAGRVLTSDASGVATWQPPPASQWTTSGADIFYNDGRVGIGANFSSPRQNRLEVYGATELNAAGIGAAECVTPLTLWHCWGSPTVPVTVFTDVLRRSQLQIYVPESAGRAELQAWNADANAAGTLSLNLSGGNVGIGTAAPTSKLDVAGVAEMDGLKLNGNGAAAGHVLVSDANGVASWQVPPSSPWLPNGPFIYFGANPSSPSNVGIGTNIPRMSLQVQSCGIRCLPSVGGVHGSGLNWSYLSTGPTHSVIWNNGAAMQFATETAMGGDLSEKMRITTDGNVGIGTATPAARLDVAGTTRTHTLVLTGGADIAEPFDIHDNDAIEPGMVVSIDPVNPGKLRVATDAYDRTVAGVVSGAGGVNPGMTLQQEGSRADGEIPVALTGRVYVRVDADAGGPVRPGDLLTTSPTRGYAMKVGDHTKAMGASIGKAMTSLDSGRGLVLVLVSLQ